MSSPVSIVLDESGLRPFHGAWREAVAGVRDRRDGEAIALEAQRRLGLAAFSDAPDFVRQRMQLIPAMAALLRDRDWRLPQSIDADLAGALAYFTDECDLIPDASPRFGLLDDALVIELALREHRDEWQQWLDFDELRRQRPEVAIELDREAWMALSPQQRDALRGRSDWTRFGRRAAPARRFAGRDEPLRFAVN